MGGNNQSNASLPPPSAPPQMVCRIFAIIGSKLKQNKEIFPSCFVPFPFAVLGGRQRALPEAYSGFNSALYRNLEAKWHLSQENATPHELQMATCELKPL